MSQHVKWIVALLFAIALTGCATTDELDGDATMGEGAGAELPMPGAGGPEAAGAAGAGTFEGDPLEDPGSPLSQRVIYFAFDSSTLSPQDLELLEAHANYLATHMNYRVIVEGHTDERGTREYNLALGERRAQAVARVLQLNGAADSQIETVSYGEEKPAVIGHDEQAWATNRRAELIYVR